MKMMVERGGDSTDAKILPVLHTGKTAKQTTCEHHLHAKRGTKGFIRWTYVRIEEGMICQTNGSIFRVDQNEKKDRHSRWRRSNSSESKTGPEQRFLNQNTD